MVNPMKEEIRNPPKPPGKKIFRYPSEDELFVRRLGSALLENWSKLSPELQEQIMADAAIVWDREYQVAHLAQKLDLFVKRHPTRMA